jgi:hypothetical protein
MTLPGFEEVAQPHVNKFVEPNISRSERARKMTKAGDPSTSYMAAEVALKSMTKRMRETLDVFESVAPRGLIGEELDKLAQEAGMKPGAAPKRMKDLADAGAIVWRGEYTNTTGGNKAKVWYKA